ncbi:MAG: hypothetical protein ACR2FN_03815 [Chitinophagaceae bacterium]
MKLNLLASKKYLFKTTDIFLIIIFSVVPLFLNFPYRVNIFLSWEGAYRLYLGEIPYNDFGLPLGFGYWIVPAIFFKIFGPYLISLIKAQVFLNVFVGLSFRSILKKFQISGSIRIAAVLAFCLSYILMNFWPWYNNSVIIYEIIGLNFLFAFIFKINYKWRYANLIAACFFLFLSFFTKQDGGFLAFLIATVLMFYYAFIERKWFDFFLYLIFYFAIATIIIFPFTKYNFGYWFNHGQPPHSSRLSIKDLLNEFLGQSQFIKFYILLIVVLLISKLRDWKQYFYNKKEMLFLLLTLGILTEAAIFQVTSYTPPDNNIFFHSFAFAYIICGIQQLSAINFSRFKNFIVLFAGVCLWWSAIYWNYIDRLMTRFFPSSNENISQSSTGENVINMHTYMLNTDTTHYEDESTWTSVPGLKSFQKIYLPPSTVAGIERVIKMPVFENKNAMVLNMTELTPLDYELKYSLEKGSDIPLWYHLGVAMFNKQADEYCNKIKNNYYDIVLFEYVPSLNNFYPFKIRDCLLQNYQKIDSFLAPRRPTNGTIEIFVRK